MPQNKTSRIWHADKSCLAAVSVLRETSAGASGSSKGPCIREVSPRGRPRKMLASVGHRLEQEALRRGCEGSGSELAKEASGTSAGASGSSKEPDITYSLPQIQGCKHILKPSLVLEHDDLRERETEGLEMADAEQRCPQDSTGCPDCPTEKTKRKTTRSQKSQGQSQKRRHTVSREARILRPRSSVQIRYVSSDSEEGDSAGEDSPDREENQQGAEQHCPHLPPYAEKPATAATATARNSPQQSGSSQLCLAQPTIQKPLGPPPRPPHPASPAECDPPTPPPPLLSPSSSHDNPAAVQQLAPGGLPSHVPQTPDEKSCRKRRQPDRFHEDQELLNQKCRRVNPRSTSVRTRNPDFAAEDFGAGGGMHTSADSSYRERHTEMRQVSTSPRGSVTIDGAAPKIYAVVGKDGASNSTSTSSTPVVTLQTGQRLTTGISAHTLPHTHTPVCVC